MAADSRLAGLEGTISSEAKYYWSERRRVPGAFRDIDFLLFDQILRRQQGGSPLLEIGAFQGKSAILLGLHAQGDAVYVNDIFDGLHGEDSSNGEENAQQYAGLTRASFEAHYRQFAPSPPVVIQEFSSKIGEHVPAGSLRFAHVDGGHLHAQVSEDLTNVQRLLGPDGVVVFDDFRAMHTPGVSAAVWGAVATSQLIPICVSEFKFYGAWNPTEAGEVHDHLYAWAAAQPLLHHGTQSISGHKVLLLADPIIRSPRQQLRQLLPPLLVDRLRPPAKPHLGS